MHIRTISDFFFKYTNAQALLFFSKAPDVFLFFPRDASSEQPYLKKKQTGLYDLLLLSSLFCFFYFIFSAAISFKLMFSIFSIPFLFFVPSQAFIKYSRRAFVYIYCIYSMYNVIYINILENF